MVRLIVVMLNWFRKREEYPGEPPDFYQEYLGLRPGKIDLHTPIERVRFVVFDTETTGLKPQRDRVLSVGAVAVQNGAMEVGSALHRFIAQRGWEVGLRRDIVIHGILPSRPDRESEYEVLREVLAYFGNSVLVGHHVRFDIKMINNALRRHGGGTLQNRSLDTVRLYQLVHPATTWRNEPNFGLDHIATEYQILLQDRHTALGDAYITALLFSKLVAKLRKRGKRKLGDLLR